MKLNILIIIAFCSVILQSYANEITVVYDKQLFILATGSNLTISYPNTTSLGSEYKEKGVIFKQSLGESVGVSNWSEVIPGYEIAASGPEYFDIYFPNKILSFGVFIHDKNSDDGKCKAHDSKFDIKLKSGSNIIGTLNDIDPPVDELFFIGFISEIPFDKVEIHEQGNYCENDFLGTIYTANSMQELTNDDFHNSCLNAFPIELNQTINAKIDYPGQNGEDGDCDYFKIEIPEKMDVSIYTTGNTDTYGVLFNCCNGSPPDCPIRIDDDNSGESNNFKIDKTLDKNTYYLKVRHSNVKGIGDYKVICEHRGSFNDLTITYPTENSIWKIGDTQTIKWHPGSNDEPVSIYMSFKGLSSSSFMYITDKTENDGEYELQVSGFPNNHWIIRILPINNPDKGVNSPEFIVQASPSMLEIFEPCINSIRHYSIGQQNNILWNWKNIEGNVNIYLSRKSGMPGTYELIGENIETIGFHLWTPSEPPSKSNIIKVESVNDPSFYGLSGYFTIGSVVNESMMYAELVKLNPNKDGNITATFKVQFDSKYFQSIEIDFDGDDIIDSTTPADVALHTYNFQEQDIFYTTIAGITDCQKIIKRICVDTRVGKAELTVFINDYKTGLPIDDANILLDNTIKIPFTPGIEDMYFLDNLVPIEYNMSIKSKDYFSNNMKVKLNKGSNIKFVKLKQSYTPFKYPDICEIRIYVPKGTYCFNNKEVINPKFLSGIEVDSIFKLNVLWGNVEPSKIEYVHPQLNNTFTRQWEDIKEEGFSIDPGSFDPGDKLCFKAIGSQNEESDLKCAEMEIIPEPLLKNSMRWHQGKYVGKIAHQMNSLKNTITSSSIPKAIPLIGNRESSFNIPFDYSKEIDTDGKGQIMFGITSQDNSESNNKKDKYFRFAGKRVPIIEKKKGDRDYLAEKGGGLSLTPKMNIEMEWINDEWDYQGGFGFLVKGDWKTQPYYFLPTPPLYARLGLDVNIDANLEMFGVKIPDNLEDDISFNFKGSLGITPKGSLAAGVGASDILSGELKGSVSLDWMMACTLNEIKNDKLDFMLDCNAELRVFFFKHEIPISSCKWNLLNLKDSNDCQKIKRLNFGGITNFSTDKFYLMPRDYLTEKYQNIPDITKKKSTATSNQSIIEAVIIENVYPYSDAIIVNQNENNEITLLIVTDDPKRSSANRTCLMAMTVNEQGQIINSTPVFDNGTADFYPATAKLSNGQILAVWNDTKSIQSDNTALEDMIENMEIASAVFEPYSNTWKSLGRITENEFLDRKPSLCSIPDGRVFAAWVANESNLYMANIDHPDTIKIAIWQNDKWSSSQKIATSNGAVLHITLGYQNNQLLVVWDEDTDGDNSTSEDRELMMCTQKDNTWISQRLTNDSETDTFPNILTTTTKDTLLIWGRSGSIVCAENLEMTSTTIIAHNIGTASMSDFTLIPRKPNGASLIWTDAYEKGGSNIFIAMYDDHEKMWGTPRQLTNDVDLEQNIHGIYQTDNIFRIIYNKVRIEEDEDLGFIPKTTDLAIITFHEGGDLAVNNLILSNEAPTPFEKIEIYASVINYGEKVMNNIPVEFIVGETVIATNEIITPLAPGNYIELSALCTLPEIPGVTIAVRVDPDKIKEDKDQSNNYLSKNVIKPNITARGVTYDLLPNNQMLLKAEIINRGASDAGKFIITLVQINNQRETIYQKEIIDGLMLSEIQERHFRVPQGKYLLYLDFYSAIDEEDETDNMYGYNTSQRYEEPVFLAPEIFDDYHCRLSIYVPIGYTDVSYISWDLDNDGVFESQTSENTIDYTFISEGIHQVNATLHRQSSEDIVFQGISLRVYNCDGDFDGNGSINLSDIIYGLKIISNDFVLIRSQCCDVNGDQYIGLRDIIYTFKLISD
ncbi:Developmentally regulated MAPK interacting protein [Candidatus Magnetomorum sp. HK-1]|nr:Developmentally regulated MAPK interacting protein [Candidatus Magnetomorum sp. HK-1]